MGFLNRFAVITGLVGGLAACTQPAGFGTTTLAKGAQQDVRTLVAQNIGKRGCVGYDAASQSCASLTRSRIVGDTLIGEEITAVRSPTSGMPVRVVVASSARIVGKDACISGEDDIKIGRGNEDRALAEFVVEFSKQLVKEAGGVCSSYFEAGEGYVQSSRTAGGQPFPPGDTAFRILDQPLSLRIQQ
jgi:hypothetical protein